MNKASKKATADSQDETSFSPVVEQHPADTVSLGGDPLEGRTAVEQANRIVKSVEAQLATGAAKLDKPTGLPSDGRLASEVTEEEVERARIVRDPWQGKNAMDFLKHPPGKRLYWCNPNLRERLGPRGFHPVQYDDPIGREIQLYLSDPPSKFDMTSKQDNVVRRGDSVLCYIDEGIWKHRQLQRELKANRKLSNVAGHEDRQYGPSGRSFGSGLQDDSEADDVSRGLGAQAQDHTAYRRTAQGDLQRGFKVGGRRMFDKTT